MTAVKKKALARFRPKQGKDKRLSRTETFLKRQRMRRISLNQYL
jgi:hypothetical protein